jgi:hypothetical protein
VFLLHVVVEIIFRQTLWLVHFLSQIRRSKQVSFVAWSKLSWLSLLGRNTVLLKVHVVAGLVGIAGRVSVARGVGAAGSIGAAGSVGVLVRVLPI